jgi:hypothetical protein
MNRPPFRLPLPAPSTRRSRWRLPRPTLRLSSLSARARKRVATVLAALLLSVLWWNFGASDGGPRPTWPREQILAAIRFVESSDRDDVADGDGGKAIGVYQIHEAYWRDAVRAEPSLGGSYQDCRRRAYAERVVAAYMQKWAPAAWAAGDAETIARVHNGGPEGARKESTQRYWERVRAALP